MDLDDLMTALASDDRFVSGDVRFPGTVSEEQAVAIAGIVHEQVDLATGAREDVATRQGIKIACTRGCRRCCAEPVLTFEHETLEIARWLQLTGQTAARAAFLDGYPRWRETMGDAPERLAKLFAAGDQAAYDAAHVTQTRQGVLCAFNHADGDCMIHPVRPVSCRNAHAIDTPDYCGADQPDHPAVRLAFVPVDDFIARVRRMGQALHHALGAPRRQPESVCVAVHRALTRTD